MENNNTSSEVRKILIRGRDNLVISKANGEYYVVLTDVDIQSVANYIDQSNRQAVLETLDRIQNNRTTGISNFGLSAEMWDEIELIRKELKGE